MRKRLVVAALCAAGLSLAGCAKNGESHADASADATESVRIVDLHPCKVTGTQLTVEDCDTAGYWLEKSKPGSASFNAPTSMIQGQSRMVTLAIGTAPPKPAAKVEPQAAAPSPAPAATATPPPAAPDRAGPSPSAAPEAATPPRPTPHETVAEAADAAKDKIVDYYPFVGSQMAADLEGDGFEITALSPRVQPVADMTVTTWEWRVKAKDYGRKTLVMKTAVVMIDSQGKPNPLIPTSQPKPVNVWIGPDGVLAAITGAPIWIKAITAVLAALATLFVTWKALRAGKPPPKAAKAKDDEG